MIKELVELGKVKRQSNYDAIKNEPISIDLVINPDGSFVKFVPIAKKLEFAEALSAKKGKARLLLDKPEEVLGYIKTAKDDKARKSVEYKHNLFIEKLKQYQHLEVLRPAILFYFENRTNGVEKALQEFENYVPEKERDGNIAFRIHDIRLHNHPDVLKAIIENYEKKGTCQREHQTKKCSVCGGSDFPILDEPHGMIKKVPNGNTTGCALISYNFDAAESYFLDGNLNSSICSNCARNYVEGLNWLLSNGSTKVVKNKKGKEEEIFSFSNRKDFGTDTAMVYWTKNDSPLDEIDLLYKPTPESVALLIESVSSGKVKTPFNIQPDLFYSLTLSGSASRIIIRDWIEISLENYRQNIIKWFEDIAIFAYGTITYPSLFQLARCGFKTDSENETTTSRIAKYLWNAALKNTAPPISMLTTVLKRIAHNETTNDGKSINTMTPERASIIRIILNRNNKTKGGYTMLKEQLDLENKNPAYISGRIFAVMEGIQRAALGKDINASIRERFFSAASSSPAPAFGRLMRLSQNHLSKLKQEKPGLAVILDKELRHLCSYVNEFPAILTLEEQGQFALGYYHQKQYDIECAKQNKEFESLTENMED